MANRRIYLVRHGEHEVQAEARLFRRLTPLGRKQARLTAKRLRLLPVTAIYSSDLPRAIETAEIILSEFDGIPHAKSRNLREQFFGAPPHMTNLSRLRDIPLKTRQEAIRQGREAAASVVARHLRPARGNDKHEIIVSHGNLIRYLVAQLLADSGENWSRMGIRNCGITEILLRSNGRRVVVSYNDAGHLPHALQT